MKKFILGLTIVLLLAFPVTVFAKQPSEPTPFMTVVLQNPTILPHNLDEMYSLIKQGAPGWNNFTPCSQKGLSGAYFRWSMVDAIEEYSIDDHGQSMLIVPAADLSKIVAPGGITFPQKGTLKVSENTLFAALLHEVLNGNITLCQQKGDITIFGSGAQGLFDRLAKYIQ